MKLEALTQLFFFTIAKDLVELSAYLTSKNMKIDVYDHVIPLDTTVDKMKLFNIGMSESTSSSLTIRHILKKSFPVDASSFSITLPDA
jgi:hypothetical protein